MMEHSSISRTASIDLGNQMLAAIGLGNMNKREMENGGMDNTDDCLDIVVISEDESTVGVLLREGEDVDGNPRFSSPVLPINVGGQPFALALERINADNHLDVIIAVRNGTDEVPQNGYVSVLFGDGDGTFSSQIVMTVGKHPSSLLLEDVDGDIRQDIIVSNESSNNLSIFISQPGDGTIFSPLPRIVVGGEPMAVVAERFDNDNGDEDEDGRGKIDEFDFIDLLTVNMRTKNFTILKSTQVARNLKNSVESQRITIDGEDVFVFLVTLEDGIPVGPKRFIRVRAFLDSEEQGFLLGCKVVTLSPPDSSGGEGEEQRIILDIGRAEKL